MPAGLPVGFAPVSALSGRLVLPALTRSGPQMTLVAKQDLSPDSVINQPDDAPRAVLASWQTSVQADSLPDQTTGSSAMRVGASLAVVLAMLLAVSMVAAGRWRIAAIDTASWTAFGNFSFQKRRETVRAFVDALRAAISNFVPVRNPQPKQPLQADIAQAFLIVQARLINAELAVSALAVEMLLRDVLIAEINTVRHRMDDAQRKAPSWSPAKAAAVARGLLRDLDRINRISQGAAHGPHVMNSADVAMPKSIGEAYRVLGINADAAPAVAKKLIDALRMSWHPDHARDEADRQLREGRMKQINAAWDLIKHNSRQQAAA